MTATAICWIRITSYNVCYTKLLRNGTAYQVELKDILPDGLNNISGVLLVKSGTGNAYINGTTTPVITAHLHVLTTNNANDTLDLAIASDGADTIQLEPDTTLTITFDAVIRITSYNVCYTKLLRHPENIFKTGCPVNGFDS